MLNTALVYDEIRLIKNNVLNIRTDSEELESVLKQFLKRESKVIRTIVSCLFFKALDEDIDENQIKILTATEIVHNASLIHDDAIDGSLFRRGAETINYEYDNKLSVIAGDFLMSKAIDVLLQLGNNDILKLYFETISKMCEGESNQYFSRNQIPSIEDYLQKTKYKTAELFKSCFVALAFYSKSQMIQEAREFAINFGIAFQIKNDLDDYRLGIENSSDVKEGVFTAPIIFKNAVVNSNSAIEKTLELIRKYCDKTKLIIENFEESPYKTELMRIIDNLCN